MLKRPKMNGACEIPHGEVRFPMAAGIENIDDPIAFSGHVIVLRRILHGICDDQVSLDIGDSEGCESLGNPRILKITTQSFGAETAVEYVDCRATEISRVQKHT